MRYNSENNFIQRPCAMVSIQKALICLILLSAVPRVQAVEHTRSAGQPYKLAGTRMVFTSWHWINPGRYDWLDDEGKSGFAADEVNSEPYESHFVSTHQPWGIRIVVESAKRHGPIINAARPWEAKGIAISTLLHDEKKYRLWGWCQGKDGEKHGCYFESGNGTMWIRPDLEQVEFEGSNQNNLLTMMFRDKSVFKDPSAPPEERYKSAYYGDFDMTRWEDYKKRRPWSVLAGELDEGRVHSIRGAVSPDGLHWEQLPDAISVEASDTQIVTHYDQQLQQYVMFTRNYMVGPRAAGHAKSGRIWARRSIGRSQSDNFREFPLSEVIITPGSDKLPTDSYYTNCRTSIPKAPDHHLMFPAVYHQDRDTTSIEIWASCDSKLWDRLPGPPILETSNFGEKDGGCVFTQPELCELPTGEWVLPYTGYNYPHKYPRGKWKYMPYFAFWPKGRMVALEAQTRGEFSTAMVLAEGDTLKINAMTQRVGHILIEAVDVDGKSLPGRSFDEAVPIIGDQFWTTVTWNHHSDLGVKKGEPIMLRVRMDKAKIYGFEFE